MGAKLRSISTAIWSDPFIEDLTPVQKLLFIYLITNEKTNMLGVYEVSIKKISFETGIKIEEVLKGFKVFERLNKVRYENNYVILVNYLKHQNFNSNMKKSAIDTYNSLPKEFKIKDLIISKDNPSKGFETLCQGFGMVRKVEVEVEVESELEVELETELEDEIEKNDYERIKNIFNSVCIDLPKVKALTNKRKKLIDTRVKDYNLITIGKVFKKVSQSNFLNGDNETGWKANFDWIFNQNNFIKILEDNYLNKTKKPNEIKIARQTLSTIEQNTKGWDL